jgi:hypothetical protein
MEREINIPDISDIKDIKSHEWMVSDLTKSIKCAKANYLVALGLFCYTEALGLQLLQFRAKDTNAEFSPRKCFNTFAKEYLNYGDVLKNHSDIYGIFRNGLCHEYFIKINQGGQGGVSLYYSEDTDKLISQGVDPKKGIAISSDGRFRFFVIEPYLNDFVSAVRRLSEEMKADNWNPDEGWI